VSSQPVRTALLDLGPEDWIPLPEAVADPEVVAEASGEDLAKAVANALSELVAEGKVFVYRGRWDSNDPEHVQSEHALQLLREPEWFNFHVEDPDEPRLYFANVPCAPTINRSFRHKSRSQGMCEAHGGAPLGSQGQQLSLVESWIGERAVGGISGTTRTRGQSGQT